MLPGTEESPSSVQVKVSEGIMAPSVLSDRDHDHLFPQAETLEA
jgi:hypothetical protein